MLAGSRCTGRGHGARGIVRRRNPAVCALSEGGGDAAWSFLEGIHPAMIRGVFEELKKETPKNNFSVGIHDDVTGNSIDYDPDFSVEGDVTRCLSMGWGGRHRRRKQEFDQDHGEDTPNHAQGYFSTIRASRGR